MNNSDNPYQLAVPGVQKLVPYTPGKPIEELERELGLTEIVKLASNENPLGPGSAVISAISTACSEISRYPDGNGYSLKQTIAEKLGVLPQQITLGNGSNEILELVARTFLTPELEVIFSQHAFAVYPLVTQAVGAKAIVVAAKEYGHDLSAMRARINENTRLIFIANPNNPTGTLLPRGELESFIECLPATVICVLDEAYFEYVNPELRADSVSWLQRYPNLIVTRTFSKAYGLAGLRVGYSISSEAVADLLNRVRQPFNNNLLALAGAEAAWSDQGHLDKTLGVNAAGMHQLEDAFNALGLTWIPSSANFISVNLAQPAMPVYQALLQKGVIVRPVANYELPEFLRVSIGTEQENSFFINALTEVLTHV